jgi:hypothetical protein
MQFRATVRLKASVFIGLEATVLLGLKATVSIGLKASVFILFFIFIFYRARGHSFIG